MSRLDRLLRALKRQRGEEPRTPDSDMWNQAVEVRARLHEELHGVGSCPSRGDASAGPTSPESYDAFSAAVAEHYLMETLSSRTRSVASRASWLTAYDRLRALSPTAARLFDRRRAAVLGHARPLRESAAERAPLMSPQPAGQHAGCFRDELQPPTSAIRKRYSNGSNDR